MIGFDFELSSIGKLIADIKPWDEGYIIVVSNLGVRVAHPKAELLGKPIGDDTPQIKDELLKAIKEGKVYAFDKKALGTGKISWLTYVPITIGNSTTPWSVCSVIPMNKVMQTANRLTYLMLFLSILLLIALIFAVTMNMKKLTNALTSFSSETQRIITEVDKGDYAVRGNQEIVINEFKPIIGGFNEILDLIADKIYYYESILNCIPWPISVTDNNMNWTFFNKAAADITGKTLDVMRGKACNNWGADICKTKNCGVELLRNGVLSSTFKQPGVNMDFQVDTTYLTDRHGNNAGHIEVVRDITQQNRISIYEKNEVTKVSDILNQIASGDLTVQYVITPPDQYTKDTATTFREIEKSLDETIARLRSAMQSIQSQSATLSAASEELSAQSNEMSSGAEELSTQSATSAAAVEQASTNLKSISEAAAVMSASVNSIVTAITQMSATISEISKNTSQANVISNDATEKASATNSVMDNLKNTTKEISKIIKIINDIADQTNMLALNATIEAASAGEAGKGFAVVANEVKELAKQTGDATGKISTQIEEMTNAVEIAVDSIHKIAKVINSVHEISTTIASSVEEQSISVNEIARDMSENSTSVDTVSRSVNESSKGIEEVAKTMQNIDLASREIAQGSIQTAQVSSDLARMAQHLKNIVDQFRI